MDPINEHSEPTKELPSAMADEAKETANDEFATPAPVQGEAEQMENEPVHQQLTEEDKQIISTVEDIIKHKVKPEPKPRLKPR